MRRVGRRHDLVWQNLAVLPDLGRVEFTADQPFDAENGGCDQRFPVLTASVLPLALEHYRENAKYSLSERHFSYQHPLAHDLS